jgi:arylformamidase
MMTGEWIDVSAPLYNGMVHWPGDAPFERALTLSLDRGDECNLSELSTTAHIGTHMDAPSHFVAGGHTIDRMPLTAGIGPARVIAIEDQKVIRIEEVERHRLQKGDRVLFKTINSARAWATDQFQENFVHIPEPTANYLARCGVQTVGVDYLSVGGYRTDGAGTHRALLGAGIWIIEGLKLREVEPGDYELICLPLKMVGAEGAPARAVLRRVPSK